MSNEHWTDKAHETIKDTCPCGAGITISAQYPDSQHNQWLKAHETCRKSRLGTKDDGEATDE